VMYFLISTAKIGIFLQIAKHFCAFQLFCAYLPLYCPSTAHVFFIISSP